MGSVVRDQSRKESILMRSIAIITARGGSKRIPHKNIKDFCGKPIIAYSIQAAMEAGCFDEIMVSTDDPVIAEVAEKYGAKVPFMRSEKNSDDFSTTRDVLREVLEEYEKRGENFDCACGIYPTAPFLTGERLREAVTLLEEKKADSVIPVVAFSFPPQRGLIMDEGRVEFKWPENALVRSQDLEPFYHDCGQFYCLDTKAFAQQNLLFMKTTYPVVMSELEVQDIDNETDWKLAELKYRLIHEVE